MSYLAQGDGFIDLVNKHAEAWPVARVAGLTVLRNRVAAEWSAGTIDYPREAAVSITRGVTDALNSLQQEVIRFQVEGFLVAAMLNARIQLALQDFSSSVGACISSAPAGGTARCPNLRSATLRTLDAIIEYYDKLGDSAARAGDWDPGNLSMVEKLFIKLYEFGRALKEGVVAAIKAAKDVMDAADKWGGLIADLVKWGSIGGGIFMLYWYVLRPKS
jgi:hypothetical protein